MIWLRKMTIANSISKVPVAQREETERVWNICNGIEMSWVGYPLLTTLAVILCALIWILFGGHVPPLGLSAWMTGVLYAIIIYLVVFPLTKVILLGRTRHLLMELKNELETVNGVRAVRFLKKLDPGALQVAIRASQRRVYSWVF